MAQPVPEWTYVLDFISSVAWPLIALIIVALLREPIVQLLQDSESGEADLRNFRFSWKKADKAANKGLRALEEAGAKDGRAAVLPAPYDGDVGKTLERSPRDAVARLYAEVVEAVDALGRDLSSDEEAVFKELQRMHAGVAGGRLEANPGRVDDYRRLVERFIAVVGSEHDAS